MDSVALKKRFVRDCSLPITVFENPYFEQRLEILNYLFHCKRKFQTFCEEAGRFQNEQEYLSWYNDTKDKIITTIKSNPIYPIYNSFVFPENQTKIPKGNLYVEQNDRKCFLSIDMKKANFSTIHYFYPTLVDFCSSWEEFVAQFTDSKHFAESKYIRQVIFGACNPKKTMGLESWLMISIYDAIKQECPLLELFGMGDDEIIIPFQQKGTEVYPQSRILNAIPEQFKHLIKSRVFMLKKVSTYGWMKQNNPFIEFKCISADIFHQIVKHYFNQEITEDDLVFNYNGQLARFLKEVDNPWA